VSGLRTDSTFASGVPAQPGGTPSASMAAYAAAHGMHISGKRPSLPRYLRELWERRDFIVTFATARLAAQYSTARLGQIWQLLTPIFNAGVYYLVFGVLLETNRGIHPFIPYLCCGVFVFNFTQQTVLAGCRAVPDNLGLIRALHFPRATLPVSMMITQLQQLLFSMVALMVIVLASGVRPTFAWLLVVPALLLQSLFNVGMAMVMGRIGAKTSDIAQVMPFVMRTWMYASGVFYKVSMFTTHAPPVVATALRANPILVYIELMRFALIGHRDQLASRPSTLWMLAAVWAVLVGVGGFVYFWQAEEEYGRA
jgi:teichoic acid transport system permease protein